MLRAILFDIWPLVLLLAFALGALATLVRCCAPRVRWRSLAALHRDQSGAVQSLSFVLTVPFFVMILLLAIQVTQLMIGLMVVQYSAFAAARSATVWIPANVSPQESANCISSRNPDRAVADGTEYLIQPIREGKFEKIRQAAALACVPIAPSRDLGLAAGGDPMTSSILNIYQALAPTSTSNSRLPQRLANKWAYANQNTFLAIRIFHRADEPNLEQYRIQPDIDEFAANEIGYRDKIQVTVTHRFALLPGPARLLSRSVGSPSVDQTAGRIQRLGGVYFVPLSAAATLGNEGEKSVVPYVQAGL